MNLLLTNYCNRSCAYCFAQDKIKGEKHTRMDLDPKDLDRIIPFFQTSTDQRIPLLGGEPTLNPHFETIISAILKKNRRIQIFSNGIMPTKALMHLKTIPHGKAHSVINANPPDRYKRSEWVRLNETLSALGSSASLGFNIDRPDFSYSFLFDLIMKHNLVKNIRLGITQPIVGTGNRFVPLDQYRDLVPTIMRMIRKADKLEVVVMFDCGFTLCMFTPAQLGRLYLTRTRMLFRCGPIIDIGPNFSVWHCFPLSKIDNIQLEQFESADDMVDFYNRRYAPYKRFGTMDRCRSCRYLLRGQCAGGCLAHTINRFRKG